MISTKDHYDFMHIPHNTDTRQKFLALSVSELTFCIFVKFTLWLVVTYVNSVLYICPATNHLCMSVNVEIPKNVFLLQKS